MAFQAQVRTGAIAEMNITPLVDVMLVLLIIFMVATPLLSRNLNFDLPLPAPGPPPPPPATVTLQIEADGSLRWNGIPLSLAAADAVLRIEAMRAEPPMLQIMASDEVEYQRVAAVLGRAQRAGLERIALPY